MTPELQVNLETMAAFAFNLNEMQAVSELCSRDCLAFITRRADDHCFIIWFHIGFLDRWLICHTMVYFSIVNNSSVFFQNLFCLFIEISGYLMNLVFLTASRTSHAHSSAHAMYFKFFGTFFTLHCIN
jgi:hypothetical protein